MVRCIISSIILCIKIYIGNLNGFRARDSAPFLSSLTNSVLPKGTTSNGHLMHKSDFASVVIGCFSPYVLGVYLMRELALTMMRKVERKQRGAMACY